ncbi:DC1 [Arabidopsis suecica]|uniref:DC1 n=1 Tax=Arabidopsis suecica TaxID=45249 RepID=A0A8T2BCX7_ARASU|nr:DC1 [Arabidopsis suecica]
MYHKLKIGYGGYICIDKACGYVAHPNCATEDEVWDGRDVEGGAEEESNFEVDLAPLVEMDGRSIRHFSHDHDLMRFDVNCEEESGQVCQACILPIDFGNLLSCKRCDFALHDACASLPRKLEHGLHRHPLTLQIDMKNTEDGFFICSACRQESCGFMYKCCQEDCGFKIDVKCASFVWPFNHIAHPAHPLLLKLVYHEYNCEGCNQRSAIVAHCSTCYFPMEFKCLTLPRLVKYKHDVHPLTLYCDKGFTMRFVRLPYWWCEVCEEEINVQKLFYICHDCNTTLHIECLMGKYPYLKHGHRIKVNGLKLEIASNNGVSRPICYTCHRICKDKLVFINGKDICFCSVDCVHSSTKDVENLT